MWEAILTNFRKKLETKQSHNYKSNNCSYQRKVGVLVLWGMLSKFPRANAKGPAVHQVHAYRHSLLYRYKESAMEHVLISYSMHDQVQRMKVVSSRVGTMQAN